MKNQNLFSPLLLFGVIISAAVFFITDPDKKLLPKDNQGPSPEITLTSEKFDPLYVKGFVRLDKNYFIVIMDGVEIANCSCNDFSVLRNRKLECPVIHRREKQKIILEGIKKGLSDRDFPVLYDCSTHEIN